MHGKLMGSNEWASQSASFSRLMQIIVPTHYSRPLILLGQKLIDIVHVWRLPELVVTVLVVGLLVESIILSVFLLGSLDVHQ